MLSLESSLVPAAMSKQPPIFESELLDGFNVRYLKLTGMWATINHQRTTGKKNLFIKAIVNLPLILGAPYIICQFIGFFTVNINFKKTTYLSIHLLAILQLFCKLLFFWFRVDSICRLYDLARKDFLSIPERKRSQVERIFRKINKKTNWILLINLLIDASLVMLEIFYPIVPVDYIYHQTGSLAAETGGKTKISGGWYPVPMDQSPYYEVIYAYEVLGSSGGGTIIMLFICFFYQLLMCLYAQFAVLRYLISTLKFEVVDSAKKTSHVDDHYINTEINKELHNILQDHQKLLSYANELRSIYNPLVTIILAMGIVFLVIDVFQFLCGETRNFMYLFRSLHLLAYQGAEVCIYCFGSSSIEEASSDLQFAIYSSDWYKADVNFRKYAQMLMMRANRGVTLTAIKMYPVNVETIMAIFQFTYSTTALMRRMSE